MTPTEMPAAIIEIERATLRRITWRIVPFLMVAYLVAFDDRVNAGFAALQMNHDMALSAAQTGLGGGLFYVSYVLCEIPSNLAVERFGAQIWIAEPGSPAGGSPPRWPSWSAPILSRPCGCSWGASEAGFFPGVI